MKTLAIKGGKAVGKAGENEACLFLLGRGHRILERNYRVSHLEIDIISEDGRGLHFVEVKSRTAPMAAAPEESVNAAKRKRIASAASAYLKRHPGASEVFFDIITVEFDGGKTTVGWFPEAWIPIFC